MENENQKVQQQKEPQQQNEKEKTQNQQQQQQQQKSAKVFNNQWILKKKISSGSFGVVFFAQDKNTKEQVAIKLEKEDNEEIRSLDREVQILTRLQGLPNIPKLYFQGQENNYNILVLSLLGPDLAHYMKIHKKFSLKTVLQLADQLIPILENIHNRSIIHRDLKPENILMGINNNVTDTTKSVYLIDFGISKIYRDSNGRHISFKENKPFIGTTRYASIAAHQGHELGRKDDLESLIYVLMFLLKGNLPWQNLQNISDRDKTQVVGEIKAKTSPQDLCKDLPVEFCKYLEYLKKLQFKATPDYKYLKQLFQKLGKQQGIDYSTIDNFEYTWTEQENKKIEEQKQKELLIQEKIKQEKLKQEQLKKEKEKQELLLKQNIEQIEKQQPQLEQIKNNNGIREKQQTLEKVPSNNNNSMLSNNQNNRINKWHKTMSLSEQDQKKDLLQLPGKASGANPLSPQPRSPLNQQSSTRDSFMLGSNLSNSVMGGSYSSVYIKYVPSNMKNENQRNSMMGMSNINFDEIDPEAEKMIKGSHIVMDEEFKSSFQSNNQKKSANFDEDEAIPEEQQEQTQPNNNQNKRDTFTIGGQQYGNFDEYSDNQNTVSQKYQNLNNQINLKRLKQSRSKQILFEN